MQEKKTETETNTVALTDHLFERNCYAILYTQRFFFVNFNIFIGKGGGGRKEERRKGREA